MNSLEFRLKDCFVAGMGVVDYPRARQSLGRLSKKANKRDCFTSQILILWILTESKSGS